MDRRPSLNALIKETKGKEVPPAARSTSLRLGTPVGAESGREAVLISKEVCTVDGGPPVRLSDLDRHCLKF